MQRRLCEIGIGIGCGGTGEAFIPQSSVKGSSLTCPCRVRGDIGRPYRKVVMSSCLPFKIMNVNAALPACRRNSRTPRGTECTSCNLFASGTNLGISPPDLRLCSPRRQLGSLHIMVILFLNLTLTFLDSYLNWELSIRVHEMPTYRSECLARNFSTQGP